MKYIIPVHRSLFIQPTKEATAASILKQQPATERQEHDGSLYLYLSRFSRSRTDSRPNGSRLRLGHLQVGDDVINKHCIALNSRV